MSIEAVTGAILAGGESRRMGKPKAGMKLADGRTMAEAVHAALRETSRDVVVLGHGQGCPEQLERLADAPDVKGPVAGLLALLKSERADAYVLASCDMPGLTSPLIGRLVDDATRADATAAVLARPGEDRLQPLPLLVRARARDEVERLVTGGERRFSRVVAALAPAQVALSEDEARRLVDVNTPEDMLSIEGEPL